MSGLIIEIIDIYYFNGEVMILESLGNTTATAITTCSSLIAFLLEDKGDYQLYFL